jgi:hypothetical protein
MMQIMIYPGGHMHRKFHRPMMSFVFIIVLVSLACATLTSPPTPTSTPEPTSTVTVTPTNTPRPSPTPRPTRTPDLAATEHIEALNAEAQKYFELGYLTTPNGTFSEKSDFREDWAQLGWYSRWVFDQEVSDFFMSGHLKWSSAYRNADISGCGFVFAVQEEGDHYAVFLDRSRIYFVETEKNFYFPIGTTRGTGRVDFGNPADHPVEADFTLIVKDAYAYVLVDGQVVGEYTLSKSKILRGKVGLALLSGTNKDFGTRCEMTELRVWTPDEQ